MAQIRGLQRWNEKYRQEIEGFKNGFQGGCWCCECVAEKNVELVAEIDAIRKRHIVTFPRIHGGFDVYDMSPAMKEGVLMDKLVEMGWTPPSGSGLLNP
ncbi:unnamed protein product [marine sediment metagenome]|uniref:Uncharacterized protein n=1 Tax=marine sediment metagenome TaxID=412755 RepID=X1CV62_9ZZZZ